MGISPTLQCGRKNGIMELSQRAPPIFGRTAITLGIGLHSSFVFLHKMQYSLKMCVCLWSSVNKTLCYLITCCACDGACSRCRIELSPDRDASGSSVPALISYMAKIKVIFQQMIVCTLLFLVDITGQQGNCAVLGILQPVCMEAQ